MSDHPQNTDCPESLLLHPSSCRPEEQPRLHRAGKTCRVHHLKSNIIISASSLQRTPALRTTGPRHAVTPFSKIPAPHFLGELFLPLDSAGQYEGGRGRGGLIVWKEVCLVKTPSGASSTQTPLGSEIGAQTPSPTTQLTEPEEESSRQQRPLGVGVHVPDTISPNTLGPL